MADQQPPKPDDRDGRPDRPARPLSEISHLFLSDVRDRQTNGVPRPQRIPPKPADAKDAAALQQQQQQPPPQPQPPKAHGPVAPGRRGTSVDLTPEEFAEVADGFDASPARPMPPVTAIIGAHLNGKQFDRAKEYARHLASQKQRVGLIELDASEFRLMCFEPGVPFAHLPDPSSAECYDPRQM